jgi:hypothetical protein
MTGLRLFRLQTEESRLIKNGINMKILLAIVFFLLTSCSSQELNDNNVEQLYRLSKWDSNVEKVNKYIDNHIIQYEGICQHDTLNIIRKIAENVFREENLDLRFQEKIKLKFDKMEIKDFIFAMKEPNYVKIMYCFEDNLGITNSKKDSIISEMEESKIDLLEHYFSETQKEVNSSFDDFINNGKIILTIINQVIPKNKKFNQQQIDGIFKKYREGFYDDYVTHEKKEFIVSLSCLTKEEVIKYFDFTTSEKGLWFLNTMNDIFENIVYEGLERLNEKVQYLKK